MCPKYSEFELTNILSCECTLALDILVVEANDTLNLLGSKPVLDSIMYVSEVVSA